MSGLLNPTSVRCVRSVYGVTLNIVALLALPPGVVTAIFPVLAPVGAVAVAFVAELTVKVGAFTPPKVTFVAPVKPDPVIVTCVPTGPLVGMKLLITGITLNSCC